MAKYIAYVRYNDKNEIAKVKLSTNAEEDRASVVRNIEAREEYFTKPPPPTPGALVHVVECRSGSFISTNRDETKRDNLERLPLF